MKILIVKASAKSSPYLAIKQLYLGLRDHYKTDMFIGWSGRIDRLFRKDLSLVNKIGDYDVIIYGDSMGFSSLLKSYSVKVSYLPGIAVDDTLRSGFIQGDSIKARINSPLQYIAIDGITKYLVNGFICHSKTVCLRNNITRYFYIIPQFFHDYEISRIRKIGLFSVERKNDLNELRVVKYLSGSYASTRLLSKKAILYIFNKISKKINRKIRLIIFNPGIKRKRFLKLDTLSVIEMPKVPRIKFLQLLASAHLFYETCLDEEIGYSSLEAATLGIPIAKLTIINNSDNLDYNDYFINSSTIEEIIDQLNNYFNNIDDSYYSYSQLMRDFIKKRTWSNIKRYFLPDFLVLYVN